MKQVQEMYLKKMALKGKDKAKGFKLQETAFNFIVTKMKWLANANSRNEIFHSLQSQSIIC